MSLITSPVALTEKLSEASNETTVRVWHPMLLAAWPVLDFLAQDAAPGDAPLLIRRVGYVVAAGIAYLLLRQLFRDRDKAGAILSVVIAAVLCYWPVHAVACEINEVVGIEFLRGEHSAVRHRFVLIGIATATSCVGGYFLFTRSNLTRVTVIMNFVAMALVTVAVARVVVVKWTLLPYGIENRVLWTTSKVKGNPDPPSPYKTIPAFPNLKFLQPLDMTNAPGSDRLFIVEQAGKIYSFPNDPDVEKPDLMFEIKNAELYSMALHPGFVENGYAFVSYSVDHGKNEHGRVRVSRFKAGGDPPRIDGSTETVIIEWPNDGHHGGCLKFGPDNHLYIATGDSSGIADEYLTGQDLGKLPGSILRIDIDRSQDTKPYRIPDDNPFLNVQGARAEIWAYGLREPWKITFDRATGDLWSSNVGQDLWETIYRIDRGGNYGWSILEGTHPFRPDRQRGPTPILPPVVEHHHSEARSLTGGYVYHGSRLKELQGAYIYGDYDMGKVWSLRYDGTQVTEHTFLVDSSLRIVSFAETNDGELFLLDHMRGTIHRLAKNRAPQRQVDFPRRLSETGLFESVKNHVPAPGIIPYSVNAPVWSDGASKERFIGLPGESKIKFDAMIYPSADAPRGWKFPDESVIAETISLEMEKGKPASRRRLETRILHLQQLAGSTEVGDQSWRGYSYVWNDEQTDAVLLEDPNGMDRTFTIQDPDSPGGKRQQTWHFPSRAECIACHNMAAKYVIGVNTLQMNRDHDYGGVRDNQLRTLQHIGAFAARLPLPPNKLPRLASYDDETQELDQRARSYLHANCAHCHRYWGGGNTDFQLLATLTLDETKIVGGKPRQGTFLIDDARVIAGGDPCRSIIAYRMATLGSGRMPRIGSGVVDEFGLSLLHRWIEQLPEAGVGQEALPSVVMARDDDHASLAMLQSNDSSAERRAEAIDALLDSTSGAMRLMVSVGEPGLTERAKTESIARATQHSDPQVRDLFERFIPEEDRTKRLGTAIKPEEILAIPGDRDRGEKVFFQTAGVACKNCHRIGGRGIDLGPDLSQIGKKYNRAQILESILNPSKQIEPKFQSYRLLTTDGRAFAGLLVRQDASEVVLKDANNQVIRIAADEVEVMAPQMVSMMPELLLRDMTAEDVADLTIYLQSLKSVDE